MTDVQQALSITYFAAGDSGGWHVLDMAAVHGPGLPPVAAMAINDGDPIDGARWTLRGTVSHLRYIGAADRDALDARSPPLGRPEASNAAMIAIRKSAKWWRLAHDERHAILQRSAHLAIGMEHLPAIARQLYHARDLGEPFDFITWFEFAPRDEMGFSEMLAMLRASEEWGYVEREVDIRLERAD